MCHLIKRIQSWNEVASYLASWVSEWFYLEPPFYKKFKFVHKGEDFILHEVCVKRMDDCNELPPFQGVIFSNREFFVKANIYQVIMRWTPKWTDRITESQASNNQGINQKSW